MNEIKIKIGDGDAQDSFEAHKLIYLDSDKRTEAPIKKRDVTSYAGEAGEHTDPRTVPDAFDYTVSFIIDGFRDAHLVHGDLSEYNILVWDGEPVVIDCGQAMTADHFNAKEYLLRDINNVNRFFKNRGADIIDPERILEEAYSEDDDSDTEEEEE